MQSDAHTSLINFVNKDLGTQISTTAITADGYDVANLLSKNECVFSERKCFMTEYFMKCPVEVVLSFPCLVNISAIVVSPKVLSQRSKCIEIYTAFQQVVDHHSGGERTECGNVGDTFKFQSDISSTIKFPCCYRKDLSRVEVREANKHLINHSGKYKEELGWTEKPNLVVFNNRSHNLAYCLERNDIHRATLRAHASVKGCSHLLIRITWATIPVLKLLEVWGTPSSYNPPNISQHIYKMVENLNALKNKEFQVGRLDHASQKDKLDHLETNLITEPDKSIIPNEFVDPITFSLMTVPLLLPSGNTVDRVTLEKFFVEEEKNGRLPSDPFTGIVFQGSRQPVPNTSLKSRIDEFLLKHNDIVPEAGKTTGQRSVAIPKTHDTLKLNLMSTKRASVMEERNVKKLKTVSNNSRLEFGHHFAKNFATKSDHEHDLKSTLNSDLNQILSSLPVQNEAERTNKDGVCGKCGNANGLDMFSLSCQHLCCRMCLQRILSLDKKCPNCGNVVDRRSVNKVIRKTFSVLG